MVKQLSKIFLFLFLCSLSASVSASDWHYLDDNQNFPLSYAHGGYFEYVDLSSCTFIHDDNNYYEFAAIMIGIDSPSPNSSSSQKVWTRYWRQKKDGSVPQFWDETHYRWVSIPKHYSKEYISDYLKTHGFMSYINHFHTFEYFSFKIVYRQLWGVSYGDGLAEN